jgi:hypothetical protein
MVKRLEYPDYRSKNVDDVLSIQINVDGIGKAWGDHVREYASIWVKNRRFARKATIWMRSLISVDFDNVPLMVDFLVQFGLPQVFDDALFDHLSAKLGTKNFKWSYIAFDRDWWATVCHIEQGLAWRKEDQDIWVPV